MIRVTIELIPFGDPTKTKHLGTIDIANDGTGTKERGNYKVRLAGFRGAASTWRTGAVRNFARLSRGPYDLLLQALASTIGDRHRRLVAELEQEWANASEGGKDVKVNTTSKRAAVRFKDIPIGQFFWIGLGGMQFKARRVSNNIMQVKKYHNGEFTDLSVDPELNQDDCILIGESEW